MRARERPAAALAAAAALGAGASAAAAFRAPPPGAPRRRPVAPPGAWRGEAAVPGRGPSGARRQARAALAAGSAQAALDRALGQLLGRPEPSVPFALLGLTSEQLFPVQHVTMLSWALLVLLPSWRGTHRLAYAGPVVCAAVHLAMVVHQLRHPVPGLTVDFSSLRGVTALVQRPDGVLASWLHHSAFDPLVGLGEVLDAQRARVPHLLVVPCLLLTALLGPPGFLAYFAARWSWVAWSTQLPRKGSLWGLLSRRG